MEKEVLSVNQKIKKEKLEVRIGIRKSIFDKNNLTTSSEKGKPIVRWGHKANRS